MKLAVIGAGPKALFCVERLVSRGLLDANPAIEIEVFDAGPPGAGAAYHPDQTPLWRLNVTSRIVSVRGGADGVDLPSFDDWRLAHGDTEPLDPFPARSLVGRYLAEQWQAVAALLPAGWTLRHYDHRVDVAVPDAGVWRVAGESFDQVLFATGHAHDWSGALRHEAALPAPLIGEVYPETGLVAIPEGAAVVSRGAALTFIDLALYLTEGRGGSFSEEGERLVYRASGHETPRLLPIARGGLFMVPKPDPDWVTRLRLEQIHLPSARVIRQARGRVDEVLVEVERCASAYLDLVGGAVPKRLAIADLTHRGLGRAPLALLEHEIAVAAGTTTADATWALGQAWRDLYPAIVEALSFETSGADDWRRFADAARRLEPIAFGPPLINARKLAALGRAGILDDFALASRADLAEAVSIAGPGAVIVDAVLPPPGVGDSGLLADLVAAGILAHSPGRRGLRVDADLRCLGADGRPVPGASAVGRPSEDVIIGNDTLNRELHDGPDRWAQRILREAR